MHSGRLMCGHTCIQTSTQAIIFTCISACIQLSRYDSRTKKESRPACRQSIWHIERQAKIIHQPGTCKQAYIQKSRHICKKANVHTGRLADKQASR